MIPGFVPTPFHQVLADKLQAGYEKLKAGHDVRMIIEAPPQHGKSTEVSELFPAWVMGKEGWPVICASYAMSLAERKSQRARDIVASEVYRWIFPESGLSENSTSKEYWENKIGASYKAVGRGGGLTGNPGKILLADDLIADKQEAESEKVREDAWDWWNTVFYTRKQEVSMIVLVETRWHLDDPAGKLEEQQKKAEERGLKKGTYDEWEQLTFPAIPDEDLYIDGKLFLKAGEALSPARFSKAALIRTKNALIDSGKIADWAAMYQQQPIISENATFRKAWFKYYEPKDLVGKQFYFTTTVDLAISQKKTADNTVVRTVAKEKDGPNWYLMEETAGQMDPLQTIEAIFAHHKKYKGTVYIESVAYQAALRYFILEKQRKDQYFFTVEELKVKSTSKKEERIAGLVPLYRAGVIFHRRGEDAALEMELMQFPKGRRDDRADVLSMQLQVIRQSPKGHAPEEKKNPNTLRAKYAAAHMKKEFDPSAPFESV